ncbi:hypothetical protein J6253_00855 [bacterium]|nr:hypothetical protein [bacterium]
MKKMLFLMIFPLFLIVSCGETTGVQPKNKGLAGFKVEFAEDFDLGSPEHRIENPEGGIVTTINITALSYDKQPFTKYNGEVDVSMLYGENAAVSRITLENGYAENVEVKMRYCLDNDRVIVQEVKKNEDEQYEPTGKMGISPVFYTEVATISAIQGTVKGAKGNPSAFNNRNLTLKDRQMVVIAVIEGGFYLHEVGVEDYSSVYMYTYSTPYVDDNREDNTFLPVGTLIEDANGSVFEFFGFTEMSFPTFHPVYVEKNGKKELKIDTSLIPEPKNINDILTDNDEMEKREASLVTVKNVSVAWFNEEDASYIEYSQFPLETSDGKTIMAQTLYTAPLFNAVAEKPETGNTTHHYNFTGILKQHTSARPSTWILVPRDMDDIECLDCDDK